MATDERPLFEDAIDVPLWLEADADRALAERRARDRGIARRLEAEGVARSDVARVRAWWTSVRSADGLGASLVRGRHVVSVGLLVLGALAGGLLAAAALRYDGSAPVNVLTAFALLVGVQLLTLVLTLLLMPDGRFGLGAVQRSLVALNPAAIAAAMFRRLGRLPPAVERLFVWHGGRSSANRFAKWQLLYWSQLAAVGLNVGILVTSFVLIAVTDLAFGWSTTLALDASDVRALTSAVSAPWSSWLPQAVPSEELIAGSQFFRLAEAATQHRAATAFTGWWPFLLASIVTYGALPRVVLLHVAAQRLRAATCKLLLEDARVTALLDRMSSPSVELGAPGAENDARNETDVRFVPRAPHAGVMQSGRAIAIVWADAIGADGAASFTQALFAAAPAVAPFTAGGAASLDDDRATIENAAAVGPRRIAVFTRAYEPPMLDFVDFVKRLRARVGAEVAIVVVPTPDLAGGASNDDVDTWRRTLARLGDTRLYVEAAEA